LNRLGLARGRRVGGPGAGGLPRGELRTGHENGPEQHDGLDPLLTSQNAARHMRRPPWTTVRRLYNYLTPRQTKCARYVFSARCYAPLPLALPTRRISSVAYAFSTSRRTRALMNCPSRSESTSPACTSSFRWCEIVAFDTGKSWHNC